MIRLCQEAGLAEPEFSVSDGFVTKIRRRPREVAGEVAREVTGEVPGDFAREVTGEVGRLLKVFDSEHGRQELQERLGLKGEENFRTLYLVPALELGLVEMTRPDAPRSRLQKYRLTPKGRSVVAALQPGNPP
jgi:ATP-dependent DNA helicase RecG